MRQHFTRRLGNCDLNRATGFLTDGGVVGVKKIIFVLAVNLLSQFFVQLEVLRHGDGNRGAVVELQRELSVHLPLIVGICIQPYIRNTRAVHSIDGVFVLIADSIVIPFQADFRSVQIKIVVDLIDLLVVLVQVDLPGKLPRRMQNTFINIVLIKGDQHRLVETYLLGNRIGEDPLLLCIIVRQRDRPVPALIATVALEVTVCNFISRSILVTARNIESFTSIRNDDFENIVRLRIAGLQAQFDRFIIKTDRIGTIKRQQVFFILLRRGRAFRGWCCSRRIRGRIAIH